MLGLVMCMVLKFRWWMVMLLLIWKRLDLLVFGDFICVLWLMLKLYGM